jgi:ribosome-binding factor A
VRTQRQERVGHLLREEISRIIERELKDPRMDGLITITDVELPPDLRHARVFVSVYGGEDEVRRTMATLERATGFIRAELGKVVRLRYLPELEFKRDESIARGARIMQLLEQVKREAPPGQPESPPDDQRESQPHGELDSQPQPHAPPVKREAPTEEDPTHRRPDTAAS